MLLTSNTPDNQDLLGAAVSHGPLGDLHQHCEHGLLDSDGEKDVSKDMWITTAEDEIKDGCLFFAPVGRNTNPLLYTDQNSASCETCPVGKGRHRLWSSNSLDRRDLNRSAHLDIRQYTRE